MLRFCRFLYALCILYVFYGTVFRFLFFLIQFLLQYRRHNIYTVNLPGFPANLQSIQLYYLS